MYCSSVPLSSLAKRFGTPLYVYDWDSIARAYREFDESFAAFPHLICASVKANANLNLLRRLAGLGSGFDIVSGGELQRVLCAGGNIGKTVFSGVGKTIEEVDAALAADILLFNVESDSELALLEARARNNRRRARFGIRVNPDVAADTHPHIATGMHRHKFGIEVQQAVGLYRRARSSRFLDAAGISFHIGSQILDATPFVEAVARVRDIVQDLRAGGIAIRYFDIGGGLGISYRPADRPPQLSDYVARVEHALQGFDGTVVLEPGRRLFAAAGALLTRVIRVKRNAGRTFVIADAGYNDFIRPILYSAYHEIVPVKKHPGRRIVDIVGPICETADAFARERALAPVESGDLLAILDAGAYGFSISSNYNSRPRPAEVLIEGGKAVLIRRRETLDDLFAPERDTPDFIRPSE
jgi:diaminopimelate decarboxylase